MRTTAKLLLLIGSAVAAVVPAMPAHAAVSDARISNFSFSGPVTIHVGDTVRWTNQDGTSHTVTADDGSFTSPSLGSQGTFSHTFNGPGTVNYHCAIHPSMQGTVTVDPVTTTAPPTTTTTAAPTTTTTAAPTTTTRPNTTTTVAGGTPSPTTAGSAPPRTTSPKPAVSPTTRATVAPTTTVPPAEPVVTETTAPAPLPEEAAPPSTQPALDTASDNYGSGGGAGIGLAVAAIVILGGGAGAGWWVIRRRRSAA
jgi:plastocyanin